MLKKFSPYAYGILVGLLAVFIQWLIAHKLHFTATGLLYPGIFFIAWYVGFGPALLTTAVSAMGAAFVLYAPYDSILIENPQDVYRLIIFFVTSTLTVWVVVRGTKYHKKSAEIEERFKRSAMSINLGIWYCDLPFSDLIWDKTVKEHFWLPEYAHVTIETFYERIHEDDRNRTRLAIENSIKNHASYDIVYRTTNPKDLSQVKFIRAVGWTDYDKDGNPIRFDGVTFDNTLLQKTSDDLKESLRLRDEFMSIASHELKTPLTSLKMQLQLFSHILKNDKGPVPEERVKKIVEVSERQVNRLNSLVEDLLDVSRIQSGKLSLFKESVDLSDLIREIAERYAPLMRQSQCTLDYKVPPSLHAKVDRIRFEQVLINLVSNAMKYAPGSHVMISLIESGGDIRITVKDNGPGIPENAQERIFKRFESVNPRDGKGLGLGLYIVRQIVEAHAGSIVLSGQPGQGAEFTITVPST